MYRIRLHGRGGQGVKTASRILGSAFFEQGFEVQDAPRYGAERRGAPLYATVRAARTPIHERGLVANPDLVVVADPTLVPVAAAGVLTGAGERTVLLLRDTAPAEVWRQRLRLAGPVVVLRPAEADEGAAVQRYVGAACAGAAARLVGVLPREALEHALREEVGPLGDAEVAASLERARAAWEAVASHAGCVVEGEDRPAAATDAPGWVDVPFDPARVSAPDVRGAATSVQVRTGLWRTMRPVVEPERCHRCHWICTTFCPDGAIAPGADGVPEIDYEHCKGCLVCVAVCPAHAIRAVPERDASGSAA